MTGWVCSTNYNRGVRNMIVGRRNWKAPERMMLQAAKENVPRGGGSAIWRTCTLVCSGGCLEATGAGGIAG